MRGEMTLAPSLNDILRNLSDDKTLALFNRIALSADRNSVLAKEMQLTPRQIYPRLSGLMRADLIKKCRGIYSLSTLGKLVYQNLAVMKKVISYYWKMKVIESVQLSSHSGYSKGDLSELIDLLINDHEIRDTIKKAVLFYNHDKESLKNFFEKIKSASYS
jgi:hypothetical protein